MRKVVLVLDAASIGLSALLAVSLHAALRPWLPFFKQIPDLGQYAAATLFVLALWLALVPVFALHTIFERFWRVRDIAWRLLKHHAAGLVALALVLFLTQSVVNRSLVGLFMMLTFALMLLVRITLGARQRHAWRSGEERPRILVAGAPGGVMAAFLEAAGRHAMPPELVGRLSADEEPEPPEDRGSPLPPVLGRIGDIERVLHDTPVDEVWFFAPYNTPGAAGAALRACETVGVSGRLAIELSQPGAVAPTVVSLYDKPFVTFEVAPKRPELLAVKHGFDVVAAAVGLVFVSPILLGAMLAVLVSMGRPVLFAQERAGRFGRRFRMLKLRTMMAGAEARRDDLLDANEMQGPVFKIARDPRVTPLGRWLRRASIDELPQLVNVLAGSMSLVGPRPLPIREQHDIHGWHRRRLSMKPGITGLWQVSGRSGIGFEEWMRLDLEYIDRWSLGLDLLILLRTIPTVLRGRGAV